MPAALRPYVVSMHAYDVTYGAPGTHRGLPSTALTLVLALDEPLQVSWWERPGPRRTHWASLAGLHTTPASIHHPGHQRGLQLALTPAGARALLGVPAGTLAGEVVDLADATPDLAELPEALHAKPGDGRAMIVRALAAALARHGDAAPRPEVGWALAALTRGAGVQQVADAVGFSRRRLGTLVAQECGVGPKEFQRIARFQRSRMLLQRATAAGQRRDLAGLAVRCGYADQSHLAREWTRLAGCSPTTWLREEFPFVQAPDAGEEAGWSS